MLNLGNYILTVKGLNLERLLNNCIKSGIKVEFLAKNSENFVICCNFCEFKRLKVLLRGYEILDIKQTGPLFFIATIKRHIALIIATILCLFFFIFWQTHLFAYHITGLENTAKAEVEKVLSSGGFGLGVKLCDIDTNRVEALVCENFESIIFASVVKVGCTLIVNVKEVEYDENLDKSLIAPIVAKCDAVVECVEVLQGTALVKAGDVVKKGQELIAPYTTINGVKREVRARGEILASTFVKGQVVFSEKTKEYVRSGNVASVRKIEMLGISFPCDVQGVPFENYEMEKSEKIVCKNLLISIKIVEESFYELVQTTKVKNFEDEKTLLVNQSRYLAYKDLKSYFEVLSEQTDIVHLGENYYITTYLKVKTNIGELQNES